MTSILVALAVLAPGAGAEFEQRPQGPRSKLPAGWTQAKADAFLKAAIKSTTRTEASRRSAMQSQLDARLKSLDAFKTRLAAATRGDRQWAAFMAKADQITKAGGKDAFQQIKAHYTGNRALVTSAYQKAQFDSQAFERSVGNRAGARSKSDLSGAVLRGAINRIGTIPSDLIEKAPYQVTDTETAKSGPGISFVEATVRTSDARISATANVSAPLPATICLATGYAGIFVTVPQGKSKLKVTIQYDLTYHIGQWALAGGAESRIWCGTSIFDTGSFSGAEDLSLSDQLDMVQQEILNSTISIAWLVEETGEESGQIEVAADVSGNKTYLVLFSCGATSTAVGGGNTNCEVKFTPKSFNIGF